MAELANSMTSDAAEEMAGSAMEVSYLYGFLASLYRTELSRFETKKFIDEAKSSCTGK